MTQRTIEVADAVRRSDQERMQPDAEHAGDIPPEVRGRDFFPYKPRHLNAVPPIRRLAAIVNKVRKILADGRSGR